MISVESVTVRRGRRTLIDRQSWHAPAGAVTAVLGPNGAGKSTVLKVITGEMTPDEGHVAVDGRDLTEWSPAALACCRAVVPQSSELAFPFTVEDVVMMGRAPHRKRSWAARDASVVAKALAAVDLTDLAGQRYPSLSGGERQRVHLARALAQIDGAPDGRRALLLDEPTAALDPAHQHQVMGLLRRLAAAGVAVVVILHDLALALRYADHMVLLRRGRVVASGAARETATAETLSAVYDCPIRLVQVPGEAAPVVLTGP